MGHADEQALQRARVLLVRDVGVKGALVFLACDPSEELSEDGLLAGVGRVRVS